MLESEFTHDVTKRTAADARFEAQWIGVVDRIVKDVLVEIVAAIELEWVLADESSCGWVEVARPCELQISLGVELARGVAERIRKRARGSVLFADRVVCVR